MRSSAASENARSAAAKVSVSQKAASGPIGARLLAAGLAATIFALDAFTSADLAIANLYVLVILIGASGGSRSTTILGWSAACAALSLLGFSVFSLRGAPPLALVHLAISLIVLLMVTLLLLRAQAKELVAQLSDRRLQIIFDTLAIAIWEHDFSTVVIELQRLRAAGITDIRRHVEDHPEFVIAMRRLVRITDMNAAAHAMVGIEHRPNGVFHLSDFLDEADGSFADCIVAIDERRPHFQAEAIVMAQRGDPKRVIIAFGLGPEASLDRVPGSILDVSHRRALEVQILKTREELFEVQRSTALAAVSASIAHELNQPMSAIHSFANAAQRWLQRDPPDLYETSQALAGLVSGVDHARTVMHKVRSLVGEARIDLAEVELDGLILTTVALMRGEAADNDTRLSIVPPDEDGLTIVGDRILLKQVLVNLITNAIQAMPDVSPELRVVTLTLARRGDQALITVADRGHGWNTPDGTEVFQPFFTTKAGGMGLGLSICRTTVERHGGTMTLGDGEAGGAVVEIALPLHRDAAGPVTSAFVAERLPDHGIQSIAV